MSTFVRHQYWRKDWR